MSLNTRRAALTKLLAVVVLGPTARIFAGEGLLHCRLCSSCDNCSKVCRLVKEDRKITTTCWGYKCEDFCAPAPSCPDHQNCETVCQSQGDKEPIHCSKTLVWTHWVHGGCGTVYTKKKLMKKTVTKKVPSYKWVVEDLCAACQQKVSQLEIPAGTDLPPTPQVEGAKVLTAQVTAAGQ